MSAFSNDVPGALLRYRTIAWVESVALVLLFFVGVPFDVKWINAGIGTLHGIVLYPLYLIAVGDLVWRHLRWPWWKILLAAVAGTIPLASLAAERYVTREVAGTTAGQGPVPDPIA